MKNNNLIKLITKFIFNNFTKKTVLVSAFAMKFSTYRRASVVDNAHRHPCRFKVKQDVQIISTGVKKINLDLIEIAKIEELSQKKVQQILNKPEENFLIITDSNGKPFYQLQNLYLNKKLSNLLVTNLNKETVLFLNSDQQFNFITSMQKKSVKNITFLIENLPEEIYAKFEERAKLLIKENNFENERNFEVDFEKNIKMLDLLLNLEQEFKETYYKTYE